MISLKNEGTRARVGGIKPEMVFASMVVERIYRSWGVDCVVTSGTEPNPKRKKGSKHLTGYALDFRTRDIQANRRRDVAEEIQEALGPDYIVLLESDHLHVGYDPEPIGEKE